jgi:anti-sigma B factor antagonist
MSLAYAGEAEVGDRGDVVIAVSGEVDIFTAPDLKRDLHAALEAADGALIIDFSNLEFIDSTGLGVLIGVLRHGNEEAKPLALVISAARTAKVFRITGLDKVFTIAPSVEEARRLLPEADGTARS